MNKCLIVVDYQNDFVIGSLGFEEAKRLEPLICEKIAEYRAAGQDVIFTFDTHGEDYLETYEGRRLAIPHCINGTEGHSLYGGVREAFKDDDIVFSKGTFGSDELYDFLRGSDYDMVELVGVVTNICVISNAVLAKTALPNADIVVNSHLTASNDIDLHHAAIEVMDSMQIITGNQ